MREVAPQVQYEMGTEVLLQRLKAVEQPVPPTALVLQDNLAVMVMEGLLNQIELMRRQHVLALEQIDCATKRKLSSPEETVSELKQAWQQLPQPVDMARAGVPTTSRAQAFNGKSGPRGIRALQGQKLPLTASQLEIVDFSANIPQWAEAAQMLFIKAIVFLAPPEQVAVVVVPTDPCTPAQYNGIVATAAAKKGKHCKAPPINNDSDYGELQFEEE
ncbi:hypothetical protein C0993_006566 [Termitomyces sp. T159_Od127]|nr:hypothetical protein C0993_006566 [Termitomyces sp. T159_Od127]